jgi:WD40 repeat protein
MKTSIPSNWRPLSRALYGFLIAIAALWDMPRNACAQLYVSQVGTGVVSKYNAKTGTLINANFITGVGFPSGLAIMGPNGQFEPQSFLFVSNSANGTVGKYDAITGATINASFITGVSPIGLAVDNFEEHLFVVSFGTPGTVGEYDATTGALINANFVTGLDKPAALALTRPTTEPFLPSFLFVSTSVDPGIVGKYNATTGATINARFITGATGAFGLALSGNTLFVTLLINGTVSKYSAKTGALISANFITGVGLPYAIASLGNTLFVANADNGTVGEYDAKTGAAIKADFITGLNNPQAIAVR